MGLSGADGPVGMSVCSYLSYFTRDGKICPLWVIPFPELGGGGGVSWTGCEGGSELSSKHKCRHSVSALDGVTSCFKFLLPCLFHRDCDPGIVS